MAAAIAQTAATGVDSTRAQGQDTTSTCSARYTHRCAPHPAPPQQPAAAAVPGYASNGDPQVQRTQQMMTSSVWHGTFHAIAPQALHVSRVRRTLCVADPLFDFQRQRELMICYWGQESRPHRRAVAWWWSVSCILAILHRWLRQRLVQEQGMGHRSRCVPQGTKNPKTLKRTAAHPVVIADGPGHKGDERRCDQHQGRVPAHKVPTASLHDVEISLLIPFQTHGVQRSPSWRVLVISGQRQQAAASSIFSHAL